METKIYDSKLFDLIKAKKMTGLEEYDLIRLSKNFLKSNKKLVMNLNHLDSNFTDIVHKIKGGAVNFRLIHLAKVCEDIEHSKKVSMSQVYFFKSTYMKTYEHILS